MSERTNNVAIVTTVSVCIRPSSQESEMGRLNRPRVIQSRVIVVIGAACYQFVVGPVAPVSWLPGRQNVREKGQVVGV